MITKKDLKYIDTAFEIAKATLPVRGSRIGAVLVRRNRVIGVGFNHYKSHPFQKEYSKNDEAIFFHAEVHAIKNALSNVTVDDLAKSTLYIARAKKGKAFKEGKWRYGASRPWTGCASCINEFGIPNVVYTDEDNKIIEIDNYTKQLIGYSKSTDKKILVRN